MLPFALHCGAVAASWHRGLARRCEWGQGMQQPCDLQTVPLASASCCAGIGLCNADFIPDVERIADTTAEYTCQHADVEVSTRKGSRPPVSLAVVADASHRVKSGYTRASGSVVKAGEVCLAKGAVIKRAACRS
jgi:hypothetical protein